MTASYRILPAADRDLDEQAGYLAQNASFETAMRFYDSVAATFEKIICTPAIGERHQSSTPALRIFAPGGSRGLKTTFSSAGPLTRGLTPSEFSTAPGTSIRSWTQSMETPLNDDTSALRFFTSCCKLEVNLLGSKDLGAGGREHLVARTGGDTVQRPGQRPLISNWSKLE
jgi:plasmid stabilization system protein ParE